MKKGLRILSAVLLVLLAVTAFVACQANGDGKSGDESGYYIEYKGTKIELDNICTIFVKFLKTINTLSVKSK